MATAVFKNFNKFGIVHNIPSKIKGSIPNVPVSLPNNSSNSDTNNDNPFKVWGLYNNTDGSTQYNFAVDVIFSYIKPNGESAQALRTFIVFACSVESAIFKATYFFHDYLKDLGEDFDWKTTHLIEVNQVFIRLADFYLDANNRTEFYDSPYITPLWYGTDGKALYDFDFKETPKYLFKYKCKLAQETDTKEICDILDGNDAKYLITYSYQDVIAPSIERGAFEAKEKALNNREKIKYRGATLVYIVIDKNEYFDKIKTVFD